MPAMSGKQRLEWEIALRDLVSKELKRMGVSVQTETKKAKAGFGLMGSAAKKATAAMKLMAAAAVFQSIRTGMRRAEEFSRSMAEVRTIMDESTISFADASKEVRTLASQLGVPAPEVAAGLYQTLSAGVTDSAQAMIMLKGATELGVAGLSTTKEAVSLLTSIFNAYGREVTESGVKRTGDMIFKLVQLGKTTIPELSSALGRVLPQAAQLGVEFESVAAAVGTLTLAGLSSSEAVTQVSAVMTAFLRKGDLAAETYKNVSNLMGANAIKTKGLTVAMQDLVKATGGSEDALVNLMGRAEGVRAVMALTGASAEDLARLTEDIGAAAGVQSEAVDSMMQSGAKRMDVLSEGLAQAWEAMVTAATGFTEDISASDLDVLLDGFTEAARQLGEVLRIFLGPAAYIAQQALGGLGLVAHSVKAIIIELKYRWAQLIGDKDGIRDSMAAFTETKVSMLKLRVALLGTGDAADELNSQIKELTTRAERFAKLDLQDKIAGAWREFERLNAARAAASDEEGFALKEAQALESQIALYHELSGLITDMESKTGFSMSTSKMAQALDAFGKSLGFVKEESESAAKEAIDIWSEFDQKRVDAAKAWLDHVKENAAIQSMLQREGLQKDIDAIHTKSRLEQRAFRLAKEEEAAKLKANLEGEHIDRAIINERLRRFKELMDAQVSKFNEARTVMERREVVALERSARKAMEVIETVRRGPLALLGMVVADSIEDAMKDLSRRVGGEFGVDLANEIGGALSSISGFFEVAPVFELENLETQIDAARSQVARLHDQDIISDKQRADMEAMIVSVEKHTLADYAAAAARETFIKSIEEGNFVMLGGRDVLEGMAEGAANFADSIPTMKEALADLTEGALRKFTTGLTDAIMAWADGTKSAKDALKEFAADFVRAVTQMITQMLVMAAVAKALQAMGVPVPAFMAASVTPAAKGAVFDGGLGDPIPLATGGVVQGGLGRALPVKGYATGGPIVTGPHLALIGEGKHNEAVVPLPDGRSIPVDMRGGSGAEVNISINAVDARGVDDLLVSRQETLRAIIRQAMTEDRTFRTAMRGA